ncbi:CvpA family protein [Thermovibrio sp.]
MSTLNVLDALIIVILGWNIIRGFNKGFVEEVISLIGIGASIYAAYRLAPTVTKYLVKNPDSTTLALTGFFIYLICFFISKYLAYLIEGKVAETSLGALNRLLGFLFGVVRGLVISAIVVFLVALVSPKSYLIKKSSLGGITVPVVDEAFKVFDGKVEKSWKKSWKAARERLIKNFYEFKKGLL